MTLLIIFLECLYLTYRLRTSRKVVCFLKLFLPAALLMLVILGFFLLFPALGISPSSLQVSSMGIQPMWLLLILNCVIPLVPIATYRYMKTEPVASETKPISTRPERAWLLSDIFGWLFFAVGCLVCVWLLKAAYAR